MTRAQERGWDVLLDAAAFVPTNALDLSRWHPDFVAISWYKVFGYPTGIGSLIVRREALARLRRPWFAGGTIGVASVVVPRHTLGDGEIGFEDGTIDYLGLPAIEIGLRHVTSVGMPTIHRRVQYLTRWLLGRLPTLRHRERGARWCGSTDRPTTSTAAAPSRSTCSIPPATSWTSGRSRRRPPSGGSRCGPAASATRVPARPPAASPRRRWRACSRWAGSPGTRISGRCCPAGRSGRCACSVGIATTERDVSRFVAFLEDFAATGS